MMTGLLPLALALFAADPADFHELTSKVTHVADGDTLTVLDGNKVREGWAWWYRSYAPKSGTLERAEVEAKKERRGLWHDNNPEPGWEFRKRKREATQATEKS